MGSNADHQRAWRQRQKIRIAKLEAAKPRKNRLGKNDDPINLLIREIIDFNLSYLPRVEAVVAALGNDLPEDGRVVLMDALDKASIYIALQAQSLRGM
jgi:hypothetical protein